MVAEAVLAVSAESYAAAYQRDGYVRVRRVFPLDEVRRLSAELDQLALMTENRPWTGNWRASAPQPKDGQYALKARHGVHTSSPDWAHAITDGRLQAVAEGLLGARARLDHSTMLIKPPETGQPFPLHQDAPYFAHDTPLVLLAIHLDTTTPENGALRFLPGLHAGLLPHVRDAKAFLDPEHYRLADAVEVCAEAGDVVAFSVFTPHGSYPNRSTETRRLVRVGWRA